MNPPIVSVLLSVRNGGPHLPRALQSLQEQSFKEWECLVMNDGSTDGSAQLLKDTAKTDKRFRIFEHTDGKGLTPSLIELASHATGPYLARQDADDWSDAHRLAQQLDFMQAHSDVAAVGCAYDIHEESGEYLDTIEPFTRPLFLARSLRHRNPLAHGSLFFKREVFEAVGGYRPAFRYAQDYDLLLRLSETHPIVCHSDRLYHLRLSNTGIGRSKRSLQQAYSRLAKQCAEYRSQQKSDAPLFAAFKEPTTPEAALSANSPLQIALHLVKSNQSRKADSLLNTWIPITTGEKTWRTTLKLINLLPGFARQSLYRIYQCRELL